MFESISSLFGFKKHTEKVVVKNDPFSTLYEYQMDVIKSTQTSDKGIICLPTGTGKSFCEAAIIAHDIIENNGKFRMYVVNAPRIILTYQLYKEICTFLVKSGVEARYMFVHSGGTVDESDMLNVLSNAKDNWNDIKYAQVKSATSPNEIVDMISTSKKQDLPLIMFSTYNSADRIEEARKKFTEKISITLNDEAHYLVREVFHDILHTLTTERCYFFTATTIHTPSDFGRGMNNVDAYGEILYTMTPRQAIDLGKMVRPRLHIVNTNGDYNTDDYKESLSFIINDTFKQHEVVLKGLKPKLLVSTKGTSDMIKFIESDDYKKMREDNIDIFIVSSHSEVGNRHNDNTLTRQKFLEVLKQYGNDKSKRMVVLHYDILAEGIDVSGFTGIMTLRSLNKSKFLQTFGRAARLDNDDRKAITSGTLSPKQLNKMNKPYAYVIVPNIIQENFDDKENFKNLIMEMRSYGFEPFENIITSSIVNGVVEEEDLEMLNEKSKRTVVVGEIISELLSEIENEEDSKLDSGSFFFKEIDRVRA